MKKIGILALIMGFALSLDAQIYVDKKGKVSFSSYAPMENIYSESNELSSAINIETRKIASKVKINTMHFENSLQQEHFNEKYMESHKFPEGSFIGSIVEDIDLTKPGEYKATAKGKLALHGIGREMEIPLKILVEEGRILVTSEFKVKVADHHIEIPKLVFQKVAEVVDVKLETNLTPNK